MTQESITLPPAKEKLPRRQICDFCKKESLEPLIFIRINVIDNYFCKKCHEYVCTNLVNNGKKRE